MGQMADFSKELEKKAAGAKLKLALRRAGVEKELELTLEEGF
jgi:S1-C subfamily serine protease